MFADILLLTLLSVTVIYSNEADDHGVILPSKCEVCKFLVTELNDRLKETGKYKEKIEMGYHMDLERKTYDYQKSELRLAEALLEPHVCDRILKYSLHKERKGSRRFAKGQSETMSTLHGLVDKGVKVDLGIPIQMWDDPPAEVSHMQKQCYTMVGDYEDNIEEWYYHHQEEDLADFLCAKLVLKHAKANSDCLYEKADDTKDKDDKEKTSSSLKGDSKAKEKTEL